MCSFLLRQEQKWNIVVSCSPATQGVPRMKRLIELVEDVAAVLSLGLFCGMVTVWAEALTPLMH